MKFYVIYSFDIPRDQSVKAWQPPKLHLWQKTEGDDQRELDYLGGVWENCKHRKYVAMLDRQDFDAFVNHCCLTLEDVDTMGSLTEYGHLPALSFSSYSSEGYDNAYVTPMPDTPINSGISNRPQSWERIKRAMLSLYA